ncbi:MAG TPA: hypothetical protein VLV45_11855 [Gemmatimonadales bacterium]|nr:hypothetical protein [Gemmatimonadales bacterium]
MRRLTWYFEPRARARRSTVERTLASSAGASVRAAGRSLEMTVGEGLPQEGQNAAPVGMSERQEGQETWVGTH